MQKEYEILANAIKEGRCEALYWLEGEEEFFLHTLCELTRKHVLSEELRAFNEYILYGKEAKLSDILLRAKQYPVQGKNQLILVRQAQFLPHIHQKSQQELLLKYAEKPAPFTVLVFSATLNSKGSVLTEAKLKTLVKKQKRYFYSKKLYDYQLLEVMQRYAQELGLRLQPKAAQMLLESIGNHMQSLAREIEKIALICENSTIEDKTVERYTGLSKDFNFFELQKQLDEKHRAKAYMIMEQLSAQYAPTHINSMLFQYFSKILRLQGAQRGASERELALTLGVHPYFLKQYRRAAQNYSKEQILKNLIRIQNTDLKIKGLYGSSPASMGLFKELIYHLVR